jgi:hypothetical protein
MPHVAAGPLRRPMERDYAAFGGGSIVGSAGAVGLSVITGSRAMTRGSGREATTLGEWLQPRQNAQGEDGCGVAVCAGASSVQPSGHAKRSAVVITTNKHASTVASAVRIRESIRPT